MGRQELIGDGENQLIPHYKAGEENLVYEAHRRKNSDKAHQKRTEQKVGNKPKVAQAQTVNAAKKAQGNQPKKGAILTQHTGLPPRALNKPTSKAKK